MNNEKNNGGYDLEGVIWHQHSNRLMKKILELWPDKSVPVVDLGCGHNFYVMVLKYAGYNAVGIDSVPLKAVDIVRDITEPLLPIPSKSNVLSLEVGEHIPAELSKHYLDNLTVSGGDIIMSWAVPGQAGVGHINCQSRDWVVDQMEQRGYEYCTEKSIALRESVVGCHCTWFRNTLMYFRPCE